MASKIKVDILETADGSGSITLNNPISGFTSTGIDDNATSTAITIDSSENVGIGTSSPSNARLTLTGTDGANPAGLYLNNTTATNGKSYSVTSGNSGEFMLYDRTSSAYRLFVNSSGNVGVGTASPAKPLDVTGDIRTSTGILFGTDTAAANTLDDYEEGTFTATLLGASGNPSTAVTTTSQYRKIGELVYITIAFENVNTAGANGSIEVSGLPFTSKANGRYFISNSFYSSATWPSSSIPTAYVESDNTKINCFSIRSNDIWVATAHNAGGTRYFWFSGTYPTGA